MAMIRHSYYSLASDPEIQELYRIVRTGYLDNTAGVEFREIQKSVPNHPVIKLVNCLNKMCFSTILTEELVEKDGKPAQVYRPQFKSEWAVLLERQLGLDPTELPFDSEVLGK